MDRYIDPVCGLLNKAHEERHFVEGVGINSLVSSDPGHGIGGAVFHDTAVWLRREESQVA